MKRSGVGADCRSSSSPLCPFKEKEIYLTALGKVALMNPSQSQSLSTINSDEGRELGVLASNRTNTSEAVLLPTADTTDKACSSEVNRTDHYLAGGREAQGSQLCQVILLCLRLSRIRLQCTIYFCLQRSSLLENTAERQRQFRTKLTSNFGKKLYVS